MLERLRKLERSAPYDSVQRERYSDAYIALDDAIECNNAFLVQRVYDYIRSELGISV